MDEPGSSLSVRGGGWGGLIAPPIYAFLDHPTRMRAESTSLPLSASVQSPMGCGPTNPDNLSNPSGETQSNLVGSNVLALWNFFFATKILQRKAFLLR